MLNNNYTKNPVNKFSKTTTLNEQIYNNNNNNNNNNNKNNNHNKHDSYVLALQHLQQRHATISYQHRHLQQAQQTTPIPVQQLQKQQQQQQQQSHQQHHTKESFLLNSITGEEESFTCPQCFRTYRRHGTLRRHLRQECGKGKSMVCSVCGHRTKRADHLRQHVRKKHPEIAMRSLFRRTNVTTNISNDATTTTTTSTINLLQQQQQQQSQMVGMNALNFKTILDESRGEIETGEIVDLATSVDSQDLLDANADVGSTIAADDDDDDADDDDDVDNNDELINNQQRQYQTANFFKQQIQQLKHQIQQQQHINIPIETITTTTTTTTTTTNMHENALIEKTEHFD